MRASTGLASYMTSEFYSYVNFEDLCIFLKVRNIVSQRSTFLYVIYILIGFSHFYMVITLLFNVLGWCFTYIPTWAIISCEPLLHQYN